MSAAHTPGPWQVYEQAILSPDMAKAELSTLVDGTKFVPVLSMVVGGPDGLCVAVTGCGPTSATNARTIAAFHDLLGALRELHRVCVGMDHPDQMQRPEEEEYLAAVAGAAAALQLVDGQ